MIANWLNLDSLPEQELNTNTRLQAHKRVLQKKPMLEAVFREFHETFLYYDCRHFGETPGLRVELGAGVFPVRESFPEVLATDVVMAPHLDRELDAANMDLASGSVRALYAQNVFHHVPDVEAFFREAIRVIKPGGGVILIEPYYGVAASFLYPRMFVSETFDKRMKGWKAPIQGPMSGANQALSFIVFVRDRLQFEELYPELEIVTEEPLSNYLRYIASGGLNFHQLLPNWMGGFVKGVESAFWPIRSILALHNLIVIRRR